MCLHSSPNFLSVQTESYILACLIVYVVINLLIRLSSSFRDDYPHLVPYRSAWWPGIRCTTQTKLLLKCKQNSRSDMISPSSPPVNHGKREVRSSSLFPGGGSCTDQVSTVSYFFLFPVPLFLASFLTRWNVYFCNIFTSAYSFPTLPSSTTYRNFHLHIFLYDYQRLKLQSHQVITIVPPALVGR